MALVLAVGAIVYCSAEAIRKHKKRKAIKRGMIEEVWPVDGLASDEVTPAYDRDNLPAYAGDNLPAYGSTDAPSAMYHDEKSSEKKRKRHSGARTIRRSQYKYQKVGQDEIRLLWLQNPAEGRGLVRRIFSVPLADFPFYTAISYAWGASDGLPPVSIFCDDPKSCLDISKSLECALQSVVRQRANRAPFGNGPLIVWADGISTNQKNLEEKSVQVSMMKEIYQQAKDVHV
ncbi:hypothetical protein BT63DRAFT_454349 [Microthyrium microscopicum]|uniref:Heterokaryon incompatibility domain-containing protein n=1 Tax=Microthyrium microscopicum TaxID=703497 RepID=A0A6A6UFA3_9PEZI|nr:hypothetical protein BT63DRAFT_454349 [Microthyrium microscopicum]